MNKLDLVSKAINESFEIYELVAKEYNISYSRMSVIHAICTNDRITQKFICEAYCMPKQSVNTEVKKLEKENLIKIEVSKESRREKIIIKTNELYLLHKDMIDKLNKAGLKLINRFGEERLDNLINELNTLNQYTKEAIYEE